ncbi:MAG: PilZ domain-containing protein, partial [Terriglobia bacterium]
MSKPALPQPFPEKRSAPRASVPVEVVLKCPDKSGKSFIEKTRTADVSRTGAKLLTEHDVNQGVRLQVAIPHLKRMSSATVARLGNRTGDRREIGIAVEETGDFWG